ncbi:MAG: bifunctional precorrin-2 dehydrogenase/sirohydrochlorin ferrochelatase, partial [Oscillospiraceae bacterium]|nr:bifunctional precorrin-2 dehydrogenase/sirohydrochlorin ferrochelatase [Oscillospiraceae bacterium]
MSGKTEYFPMFTDISGKKILVIGGGTIATRRVTTLLRFTDSVTVVSPDISESLEAFRAEGRINLICDVYRPELLDGAELVLACTSDNKTNGKIYDDCRSRGITVNVCSDKDKCDFYFPGVVITDNVVVG